jgi:hypothetical protein
MKEQKAMLVYALAGLSRLQKGDVATEVPELNGFLSEGWRVASIHVLQDQDNAATNARNGALFVLLEKGG